MSSLTCVSPDAHEPVQQLGRSEQIKKILLITAVALAAIGVVGGLIALTIFFPHVMLPILGLTIVASVGSLALLSLGFSRFGH